MSTFSENLFAVLGEGGDESITAPNKEEKNKKVEQAPKSENKRATKKANDTTGNLSFNICSHFSQEFYNHMQQWREKQQNSTYREKEDIPIIAARLLSSMEL